MSQSSLPDRTYYIDGEIISVESQCTYRCVVLPDVAGEPFSDDIGEVSMHLQGRGAP